MSLHYLISTSDILYQRYRPPALNIIKLLHDKKKLKRNTFHPNLCI